MTQRGQHVSQDYARPQEELSQRPLLKSLDLLNLPVFWHISVFTVLKLHFGRAHLRMRQGDDLMKGARRFSA